MARKSNTGRTAEDANTDARGTVSVGCRLPAGLTVTVVVDGEPTSVTFKGANDPRALALADEQGFHGITSGVPEAVWKAVEEQCAKAKWLIGGYVFAAGKRAAVLSEAQDLGDRNAGFNQIDPDAPAPGIAEDDGK